MHKQFSMAAAAVVTASLLLSGCSSDESPTELDILINQLQTVQLTSETVPEEITEDETDKIEEPAASETTEDTSQEETEPENTENSEASSEDTTTSDYEVTTPPESTEETSDVTEDNTSEPVTYKSLTVTVISVEEDHIMVELDGVVYKAFIDESTSIFGGEILKDKTVTITYVLNDDDSEAGIAAAAITVLP